MVAARGALPPRIVCPLCHGDGRDNYSGACALCGGETEVQPFTMSMPCKFPACGGNRDGFIRKSGPNNTARCSRCFQFQYCPSKAETGEAVRSINSREDLSEDTRERILKLDNYRCLMCGRAAADGVILHVAHIVSVKECQRLEIDPEQYNSDGNLFACCEEDNLKQSWRSLDQRFWMTVMLRRSRKGRQ